MGLLIALIFAKIGSKRVIGGFTSFMLCLFVLPMGIYVVLKSRKMDDKEADIALLKEFATPYKLNRYGK
jgi:hypothetical protein